MFKLRILLFFVVSMCEMSETKSYKNTNNCDVSPVYSEMVCPQPMPLRDICESIRNDTDVNITLLLAKVNDTTLTKEDFIGCETLKELSLTNSSLINLEKDALSKMTILSLLDLSYNKLDVYKQDAVYELILPRSLHTLKLNGNIGPNISIEHLKYPILYQSNELRALFIDGLPNRDFDIFRGKANSLERLTMSSKSGTCSIPYVKKTTFQDVRASLKYLNISDCNITVFEFGALQNHKELEHLDLSYNRDLGFVALENISYGLQFTKIKVFNYSYVHKPFGKSLTVRKRDLCYLYNTSVEELALEGNRIDLFESNSLILLPSVKTFRCGSNRLTIGVYTLQLGCISNLTDLHAGYLDTFGVVKYSDFLNHFNEYVSKEDEDCNIVYTSNTSTPDCPFMTDEYLKHIANLPDKMCNFYDGYSPPLSLPFHIKNIFAPQCGFVSALTSIINLDLLKLEKLDLSRNRIYKVPSLYIKANYLKYLDLSENRCWSLDINSGRNVSRLEHFNLQNNLLGLSIQDGQFVSFPNLRVLNLSDNLIHDLPRNVFINMSLLKVLDLSSNKIQKWTAKVDSLKSLLHLNLSSNVIDSLPFSLLNHFNKRKQNFSIDLRNNTIQCSCDNQQFLHWIVEHKERMTGYEEYQFYDGDQKLTVEEFEHKVLNLNGYCQSYLGYILFPSVFLIIFFIAVVGGIVYRNRWPIRYFLYMTKRKYFSYDIVQEEETGEKYKYEAFVSYAEDNAEFVSDQLVPKLEQHGLSLCVHQRDFIAGRPIIDNIINAVQSSRITLVILSREFVSSRWCMYEFQMARMESIYTRDDKGCLLIVMKDTIPIEEMPLEMLNWIKYESYLEYSQDTAGERLFWERLKEIWNIK